jgi:hypothetical protein
MKLFATLATFSVLLFAPASAQDMEADAMRDLQLGLLGIQEAAKNPVLLAQLMQDLQVGARYHIEGIGAILDWSSLPPLTHRFPLRTQK